MNSEDPRTGWSPEDAQNDADALPPTEAKGELTPPPRKPPTAVGLAMSGPEPRPPRPAYRWGPRTPRSNVPRALAEAVDLVLDVLDSVGDSVRTTAARMMR